MLSPSGHPLNNLGCRLHAKRLPGPRQEAGGQRRSMAEAAHPYPVHLKATASASPALSGPLQMASVSACGRRVAEVWACTRTRTVARPSAFDAQPVLATASAPQRHVVGAAAGATPTVHQAWAAENAGAGLGDLAAEEAAAAADAAAAAGLGAGASMTAWAAAAHGWVKSGVGWCAVLWCGVVCCGVVWCGVQDRRQSAKGMVLGAPILSRTTQLMWTAQPGGQHTCGGSSLG